MTTALVAAAWHAGRLARRRKLGTADREDLVQDILLAIVAARPRYDATRGAWSTYVSLIARRVVAEEARRPHPPVMASLDAEEGRWLRETLSLSTAEADHGLALAVAIDALPAAHRALLRRITARGDVVAAREAHRRSRASFYRELQDLRCWLRMLGARPAAQRPSPPRRHAPSP